MPAVDENKHFSPMIVAEERGWFQEVDIFTHVCRSEPIPTHTATSAPMPSANLFETWRAGVLLSLGTEHLMLWNINDGNIV